VEIAGMIITVDRQEKGLQSEKSAVQEVKEEFGIDVYSIVTVSDIIAAIENGVIDGQAYLPQMRAYREQYGV
jgi:orotate phosphoribosyltransferase